MNVLYHLLGLCLEDLGQFLIQSLGLSLYRLLGRLRFIAQTWYDRSDSMGSTCGHSVTQPESPERAIEVLRNLAKGHALLTGRNYITLEDIPIVLRTALSTAIIDRVHLLYLLMAPEHNGTLVTTEIADALKVTKKTALRKMTELWVIGLVEMGYDKDVPVSHNNPPHYPKYITLKKEFQWLLDADFEKLRYSTTF
jgi:hypothetical protein